MQWKSMGTIPLTHIILPFTRKVKKNVKKNMVTHFSLHTQQL